MSYSELDNKTEEEKIRDWQKGADKGNFSSYEQLASHYLDKSVGLNTNEEIAENGKKCFESAKKYIEQFEESIRGEGIVLYPKVLKNTRNNLTQLFLTDDYSYFYKNEKVCLNYFIQKVNVLKSLEKSGVNVIDKDLFSPKLDKSRQDKNQKNTSSNYEKLSSQNEKLKAQSDRFSDIELDERFSSFGNQDVQQNKDLKNQNEQLYKLKFEGQNQENAKCSIC